MQIKTNKLYRPVNLTKPDRNPKVHDGLGLINKVVLLVCCMYCTIKLFNTIANS